MNKQPKPRSWIIDVGLILTLIIIVLLLLSYLVDYKQLQELMQIFFAIIKALLAMGSLIGIGFLIYTFTEKLQHHGFKHLKENENLWHPKKLPLGLHGQVAVEVARIGVTKVLEPVTAVIPAPFKLSESGWKPEKGWLYLAKGATGWIKIRTSEAWHVAFAGPTGGGKSNALLWLIIQLAYTEMVYFINPHYMKIDEDSRNWDHIPFAEPPFIALHEYKRFLEWIFTVLSDRKASGHADHAPIYICIDETPVIKAEWPQYIDVIGPILREGRKYKIYVLMCSQDLLIKTIGGNSGIRECYRTAFGFTSERNTLNVIADKEERKQFNLNDLGVEGKVLLRAKSKTSILEEARIPYVDILPQPKDEKLGMQHEVAIVPVQSEYSMPDAKGLPSSFEKAVLLTAQVQLRDKGKVTHASVCQMLAIHHSSKDGQAAKQILKTSGLIH